MKSNMREKLLFGTGVIALVLISTFLVAVLAANQNNSDNSELSERQESLKLLPLAEITEDEAKTIDAITGKVLNVESDLNDKDEKADIPISGSALEKASAVAKKINYKLGGNLGIDEIIRALPAGNFEVKKK